MSVEEKKSLLIGWASADITPTERVCLMGQFHTRISEGVRDPITATALVLHSPERDGPGEQAIMVSSDLAMIPELLRDGVRDAVRERVPELDVTKVFLNATHTHTAPIVGGEGVGDVVPEFCESVMMAGEYRQFAINHIAGAVEEAWARKAPGGISFGLGQAVVGHCRRWVDCHGEARMYAMTNDLDFRHFEGYEDHAVNLLFTWNREQRLSGMIVNLACTSQRSETEFQVTADFWYETRNEIRKRHGEHLFILPQSSPAGDQSPRNIFRTSAEERMLELAGRSSREEIARRLANAVDEVLPVTEKTIEFEVPFRHLVKTIPLSRRLITQEDVEDANAMAEMHRKRIAEESRKLEAAPSLKEQPRWYVPLTRAQNAMLWNKSVEERFKLQDRDPTLPVELHVIRLGDVAFATNRFELYLDFGIRIQVCSKAVQTFLVQLAGNGTYLPTARSVAGKGYGSVAASTLVGPEGGQELVVATVELINSLWNEKSTIA